MQILLKVATPNWEAFLADMKAKNAAKRDVWAPEKMEDIAGKVNDNNNDNSKQ